MQPTQLTLTNYNPSHSMMKKGGNGRDDNGGGAQMHAFGPHDIVLKNIFCSLLTCHLFSSHHQPPISDNHQPAAFDDHHNHSHQQPPIFQPQPATCFWWPPTSHIQWPPQPQPPTFDHHQPLMFNDHDYHHLCFNDHSPKWHIIVSFGVHVCFF